jgi:hypothetical protein
MDIIEDYIPVSDIITTDSIPDSLDFVREGLDYILSKILYKLQNIITYIIFTNYCKLGA